MAGAEGPGKPTQMSTISSGYPTPDDFLALVMCFTGVKMKRSFKERPAEGSMERGGLCRELVPQTKGLGKVQDGPC